MHATERALGEQHREQHPIDRMLLHALDAWVGDASILTDAEGLSATLYAGADAGGATVVGEEFHVFPNGAVTGVLVLAQSHLSIHTWPELALANVDLLSYGDLRAERALDVICMRLGAVRSHVTCVERAIG